MATKTADESASPRGFRIGENMRGAAVMVIGAVLMIGIGFAIISVLTSPDGWISRAASQAMTTAEQGALASYGPVEEQ